MSRGNRLTSNTGSKTDLMGNECLQICAATVYTPLYLPFNITVHGGIETEAKSRINDVGKVLGGMKKILDAEQWR